MVAYVYSNRRRHLAEFRSFSSVDSESGRGVPRVMMATISRASASQPRVSEEPPEAPTPPPKSPRLFPGNTQAKTADAQPPTFTSAEFIDYRNSRNEQQVWIQRIPQRQSAAPEPVQDLVPAPGSVEDHREISSSPRVSNDHRELDIDEILEMATMYSASPGSKTPAQPFTPATMSSRNRLRAPSDVPVGAEHMSAFYPSGTLIGSQLYTRSQQQSVSVDVGERHLSVAPSVGGVRESTAASLNPEITTATRAERAAAWVARIDS
jgi:hypothetical protein